MRQSPTVTGRVWRRRPVTTAIRVAVSLVRRRSRRFQLTVVDVGHQVLMQADLTTALGLGLFRYGLNAPELVLLERLLGQGDTFIDAGAHVGTFALVAAQTVGPTGRVIAIEPAMPAAEALGVNLRLNSFECVELHAAALTDRVGRETFFVCDADDSGFSSFAPGVERVGTAQMTETTTLDDAFGGIQVDFIKLDVEGSEARVLAGGKNLLASSRPHLLIEIEPDHLIRQGSSPDDIDAFLFRHGYSLWELVAGSTTQLRRLLRSADRSASPNVFATVAPPFRLEEAGFRLEAMSCAG